MEPVSLYSKDYEIDVSLVDFSKRIKLGSLFVYFQDIAVLHADNLGVGMGNMLEKHNAIWVLARMRVDIEKYPLWGDKITLETWANRPNKIECMRNFLVKDSKGNILIRAISTWVVMDVNTRKPKRADSVFSKDLVFIEEKIIDAKLGGLKANAELQLVHKRVVGYSDIDVYEHLNNAKYVDFVTDCFNLDEHKKYNIHSIEINYLNESLPGDTITLYKGLSERIPNSVYIEGTHVEGKKVIFKAEIKVEPVTL